MKKMRFHSTRCDDVYDSTPKTRTRTCIMQLEPGVEGQDVGTNMLLRLDQNWLYRKDQLSIVKKIAYVAHNHMNTISIESLSVRSRPVDSSRTEVNRVTHVQWRHQRGWTSDPGVPPSRLKRNKNLESNSVRLNVFFFF